MEIREAGKLFSVEIGFRLSHFGIMKTTIGIPDRELADAIRLASTKTKREAVVTAAADFNRRMRMAELIKCAGTYADLMAPQPLRAARRRQPACSHRVVSFP